MSVEERQVQMADWQEEAVSCGDPAVEEVFRVAKTMYKDTRKVQQTFCLLSRTRYPHPCAVVFGMAL